MRLIPLVACLWLCFVSLGFGQAVPPLDPAVAVGPIGSGNPFVDLETNHRGTWGVAWTETTNPMAIRFSRSTDRGATWSFPQTLSNALPFPQTLVASSTLATDGQGNWLCAWLRIDITLTVNTFSTLVSRSSDDGVTWSSPIPLGGGGFGTILEIHTDGAAWVVSLGQGLITRSTDAD